MYKAVRYVNSPTSGRESCSCDVRLMNERWRCCWCWWCDCWSSALCWRQCWSQSVQSTVASLCYSLVFDVMWLELEALIGASTLAYVQTILGLCLTKNSIATLPPTVQWNISHSIFSVVNGCGQCYSTLHCVHLSVCSCVRRVYVKNWRT